jgi:hypothetical protein
MPGFWGADSVDPLTTSVSGTNLADWVINHQFASPPPDQIVWWGRYFDLGWNQSAHWQGDGEANALSSAVKTNGNRNGNPSKGSSWILPISVPYNPYNINGTYSDGVNAGNYVSGVIKNSVSSRLHIPGNGHLNVYLDIESGAATNVNFLNGWATAVNSYQIGSTFPLWACVYINSYDSTNVNKVQQSPGTYYAAWTTTPSSRNCTDCNSPGPGWAAVPAGNLATHVWQYGIQGNAQGGCNSYNCGFGYIYIDFDQTDPAIQGDFGNGMCDNMLWIPLGAAARKPVRYMRPKRLWFLPCRSPRLILSHGPTARATSRAGMIPGRCDWHLSLCFSARTVRESRVFSRPH